MDRKKIVNLVLKRCGNELEEIAHFENRAITPLDITRTLQKHCEDTDQKLIKNNQSPISAPEKEELNFRLGQRRVLVKPPDEAVILAGEVASATPWIKDAEIQWELWENYRAMLLSENKSPTIISQHEITIDRALELTGDPKAQLTRPPRKGLVMGNVQSGKTMNFVGLINKAIDAGYHTIIVLGGHMNELRKQAQLRIESGVIEVHQMEERLNSETMLPDILTTQADDFNATIARQKMPNLSQTPCVYVVKKLPSVLERLSKWFTAEGRENVVSKPMLLIDDEADYASINTKYAKDEVTRTNSTIRGLLDIFNVSTYVAYTATPFANVFIPFYDSESESENDELFPADFMIKMPLPENYSGQDFYFIQPRDTNERNIGPCRIVDESSHEGWLKLKHKRDAKPDGLHPDLINAIYSFICVIAIRHLRGQSNVHNTMLVNVSRFNDVQEHIAIEILDLVKNIKGQIKAYGSLGEKTACDQSQSLHSMQSVFLEELASSGFSFDQILSFYSLEASDRFVTVEIVNGARRRTVNAPQLLDYEKHDGTGLWVIAVGGLKLSRGLTLEGLSVSYFYRNALAYDTLTQMCRWFGYRPNYEDLCRLYLLPDSYDHYFDVSQDIRALYDELKLMEMSPSGGTPRDFGMKVRNSETALTITAKNKMGSASSIYYSYELWGDSVPGLLIPLSDGINSKNFEMTQNLVRTLLDSPEVPTRTLMNNSHVFREVPYDALVDFISNVDIKIQKKQVPQIGPIIKALEELKEADFPKPKVVFFSRSPGYKYKSIENKKIKKANGEEAESAASFDLCNLLRINMITRTLSDDPEKGRAFSKNKNISDPDDLKLLFETNQYEDLLRDSRRLGNRALRTRLEEPVLVIYLFRALLCDAQDLRVAHTDPSVAFELHFPAKRDGYKHIHEMSKKGKYFINEVLRKIEEDDLYEEEGELSG